MNNHEEIKEYRVLEAKLAGVGPALPQRTSTNAFLHTTAFLSQGPSIKQQQQNYLHSPQSSHVHSNRFVHNIRHHQTGRTRIRAELPRKEAFTIVPRGALMTFSGHFQVTLNASFVEGQTIKKGSDYSFEVMPFSPLNGVNSVRFYVLFSYSVDRIQREYLH